MKSFVAFLFLGVVLFQESFGADTTLASPPPPPPNQPVPLNFRVVRQRANSLTLTWDPPLSWTGNGNGYAITTYRAGENLNDTTRLLGVDNRQFTPSGLKPSTNYTFFLVAFGQVLNEELESDSVVLNAVTADFDEPSTPRNFRVVGQSSKELNLAWDQPRQWNSIQTSGYYVEYSHEQGDQSVKLEDKDITTFSPIELKLGDWYTFNLTAYNLVSGKEKISEVVQLTVQAKPAHPINLQVSQLAPTEINVTWNRPVDEDIDGYVVTFLANNSTSKLYYLKEEEFGFGALPPWSLCVFHVSTYKEVNGQKVISESTTLSAHTNMTEPSVTGEIKVLNLTDKMIAFHWKEPDHLNGPLTGYRVLVLWDNTTFEVTTADNVYTFEDFPAWVYMNISVTAFNLDENVGPLYGPEVMVYIRLPTAPGVMEPPKKIGNESTVLQVTFKDPEVRNGPIDGFMVTLRDLNGTVLHRVTPSAHLAWFRDLPPWTEYIVSVCAFNEGLGEPYWGPEANATLRTSPGQPDIPTDVKVGQVTNTSMEVTFGPPMVWQGPMSGYVIECRKEHSLYVVIQPNANYTFQDLEPWSTYEVTVKAFNQVDQGRRESREVLLNVTTSASAPPYPSKKVEVASTKTDSATLKIPVDLFSTQNGDIEEFVLLVTSNASANLQPMTGYDSLNETGFPTWDDYSKTGNWYRASPTTWIPKSDSRMCSDGGENSRNCVIGPVKDCKGDKYCGGALKANVKHWAKIRGYTSNGFSESAVVSFDTVDSAVRPALSGLTTLLVALILKIVY